MFQKVLKVAKGIGERSELQKHNLTAIVTIMSTMEKCINRIER